MQGEAMSREGLQLEMRNEKFALLRYDGLLT